MEMYKKILILFLILLIGTIVLASVSYAAEGLNQNVTMNKGNEEMLAEITNGGPNYILKTGVINNIKSGGFTDGNLISGTNTYSLKMNSPTTGSVIYKNNWVYCIEHGTSAQNGELMIEKLVAITNRNRTTIRYARPNKIILLGGTKITHGSPKYYAYYGNVLGNSNTYAKYVNGNDGRRVSKYIVEKDGSEYKFNEYYKTNESSDKIAEMAYILSEPDTASYTNYDTYANNNSKQRALWQLEGQLTGKNSVLTKAENFAQYKNNVNTSTKLSRGTGTSGPIYRSEYVLIGPFQVKFLNDTKYSSFTGFKSIRIYYNDDENKYIDINANNITNSEGTKVTVSNGTNFYIKISNTTMQSKSITKINKVTAYFKDLNVYALYSFLIQTGEQDIQNQIVLHKAEREYGTISKSLDINSTLIPPLKINITKKSTLDDSMMSGVGFNVKFEQNGSTTGNKTVTTTSGIANCEWQPSNRNEIKVTITETSLGTYEGNHKKIDPMEIRFVYDTSTNTWRMSSRTESSYLSVGSGSPVPVTIKNQYISPIVIGGDNGGFNKVDQAGNPISGAMFEAVFTQGGSTIATKYATSGSNGKLSFAQVQPTTTANVTVTITEISAPTGYVNSGFSKTIEFKYNTATKTWEPVNDSTVSVKYESKKTFVKLEDVVNESRIEELEILKQDSVNGSTLSGAKFKITLENVKSVKGYSSSGSGTQVLNGVTTNTQGKIVLKEIVIKDAAQDVIITIEETESPNGYKKIDGKIIIVITRTGTQYKIVRYKDNTVLDEEFVATVIDETGRVPGDVSGNGLVNSGDALLVLQYTMGLLDSSERAKVEENGDLNGDGRITSEDADLILQYSVGLVSSSSDSVYFEKIANGERGDADSDGQITANDALAVLKYSTDLATPNNAQRTQSDVNEDGNVNSSDALIILKYLQYANGRVVEGENVTDHNISLTIKDIPGIQELVMNKADSQNGNPVAGAEFEVSFGNVRSVNGTNYTAGTKIKTTTNADGHFDPKIEKIIAQNVNAPIKIYITETKAPIGYKKIEGTITLEVSRGGDGKYTVTRAYADESVITPDEFNSEGLLNSELDNNYLYLNINNIPVMNLGGIVWEDTQSGEKLITGPDGIYNNGEQGMPNIEVKLFKGDNEITTNIYGETLMNRTSKGETSEGAETLEYKLYNGETDTITLSKGQYIFANIERGEDYKVQFTYDGINYKTVPISENWYANNKQSKVNEIDRAGFNNRFKTISPGQSNDGTTLEYEYSATEKTSSLITMDGNTVLDKYKMKAESVNYLERGKAEADWKGTWTNDGKINTTHYALDVNCGLTYKFFDLALGKDIDTAEVKINGESTTYSYAELINGEVENISVNTPEGERADKESDATWDEIPNIRYNLNLYASDYNFRIEDYLDEDQAITNTVNPGSPTSYETNELEVYVTYKIILKNQSTYNANINKIVDYYNSNYEYVSCEGATVSESESRDNALVLIPDNTNVGRSNDYRQVITITFKVKGQGRDIQLGEYDNIAEILEYSTDEGGLIDCDSAPGNIQLGNENTYEDDTGKAPGINIQVPENVIRTITGTVWYDGTFNGADGKIVEGESKVNDVIVQLIEVKNIGGTYYEYIWQETRSGRNSVRKLDNNGTQIAQQTVYDGEDKLDGSYKFEGFIPGNYIIRFIYGDGTTYDINDPAYSSSATNVKTYNGQDYKSTIDPKYNVTWYNNASYDTDSKARDNEARRLEVMSYSTTIDNEKGQKLENKTDEMLINTWMAAETSRIYIAVDTDNLESTGGAQTATESGQGITFSDVNFGLALRPQTKLELEKHITGLKITPNGVGVQPIIDATADVEDMIDKTESESIETSGITKGLAAMSSVREDRGFWKVATDIEELAQGAELEVEYTYVIKNVGEDDYLSNSVLNEYNNIGKDIDNNDEDDYVQYLNGAASLAKTLTKGRPDKYNTYLGEFYYTGIRGDNDKIVSSRVETIEEALNNDLKFDDAQEAFMKTNVDPTVQKSVFDTDGVAQTKEINTIVQTKSATDFLTPAHNDHDKKIRLTTVLSSSSGGELGANLPSYIAEIVEYSNAAGRRDMESEPENLGYVHSDDPSMTLETYTYRKDDGTVEDGTAVPEGATIIREKNEPDEFWGETIIIGKPEGENKQTGIQIAIITTSAVALLGVGIVLIKKFVLKK